MLFREIIVVNSNNHIKPAKIFCGQNNELLYDKVSGA